MTNLTKAVVLLAVLAVSAITARSQELELAPLPVTPSAERRQAVASLSPFAEPVPSGMPPEHTKECVRVFTRQGRWPILVEYEDGSRYWGEVSEIGWNTFKLLNRQTNQEETLSYAGIRSIGVVDAYGAANKYSMPTVTPRRRLPVPPVVLTPEEASYKLAVQKLGVDRHRFIHVDLPKGKVRTGVITAIRENGFALKDGIFATHEIAYTDLKAAPRPVAAVGTRIGQGFKWAGVGLGMVAAIPLLPFAFLFWDGC